MGIKLAIAAGAAAMSAPGAGLIAVATVTAPNAATMTCPASSAATVVGGDRGSGLQLDSMPSGPASTGTAYAGRVRMTVANLPTTHRGPGSLRTVPGSLASMARSRPDFMALNEVSRASSRFLEANASGYRAYKGPPGIRGDANGAENAVLWDSQRWSLVDGGRVRYVEHDLVVFKGRPVDWNRYAVWTVLKSTATGAQVVVIATHDMTNPQVQRRTHGNYAWPSRVAQYADGMRRLRQLVTQLSAYGPVLMAGDMNVHARQGAWSAPDQMARSGYNFTHDHAVIYQFFPHTARVVGTKLVRVSSDHPYALQTTLALGNTATTPPEPAPQGEVPTRLTAMNADGQPVTLDRGQVERAMTVIAVGASEGVPVRGQLIAVMAALTESSLRVLSNAAAFRTSLRIPHDGDGADHDSLGLFQQRPSTGWGPVAQLMDPVWSSRAFYGGPDGPNHGSPRGLLDIPGWQALAPGAAAQAVEGSAHPDRYAVNGPVAEKVLSVLAGVSTSELTGCGSSPAAPGVKVPAGFAGALIGAAASQLGRPYVWGGGNFLGPTGGGFDCSGLVLYAAYQASGGRLRLPHYTGAQIHLGHPVAWEQKQPGDLIFFTYPGATRPHHVAIYLGGDRILQAPHTGDVVRYGTIGEFAGQQMTVRRLG